MRHLRDSSHRSLSVWLIAAFLAASTAANAQSTTLIVDAKANIFGAGHQTPPAPAGGGSGILPVEYDLSPHASTITFSDVTGLVSPRLDMGYAGPDGDGGGSHTNIDPYGGISGIVHQDSALFLTGVFLDEQEPSGTAPPRLDFTGQDSFPELSPALRQTFFIGDGLTGTGGGQAQQFHVPQGATRLFLGFSDALAFRGPPGHYGDNLGSLNVTVAQAALIEGVPNYRWNYGCTPTCGGMIIGYWDNQPGYENLVTDTRLDEGRMPMTDTGWRDGDNDARHDSAPIARPVRPGTRLDDSYNPVDDVIANSSHVLDYWNGKTSPEYPTQYVDPLMGLEALASPDPYWTILGNRWEPHPDNCIADFMRTSRFPAADGGTRADEDAAPGLENYVAYRRQEEARRGVSVPLFRATTIPRSYGIEALTENMITYIDRKWPVMVNIALLSPQVRNHSIAVYGYMRRPDGLWVAVNDTDPDGGIEFEGDGEGMSYMGREWWKWENTNFAVTSIVVLWPDNSAWYGAQFLADRFSMEAAGLGALPYAVDPGASDRGTAEIVESPLGHGNGVLKLWNPDLVDSVAIVRRTSVAAALGVRFAYLFGEDGKITISLGDEILGEVLCPADGPGAVGAADFGLFEHTFVLEDLSLDSEVVHSLRIEVASPDDPLCYLDDLEVWCAVPEPSSVTILVLGALHLSSPSRHRRRRSGGDRHGR